MPIYDFKCTNCNKEFKDKWLKNHKDRLDHRCVKCGGKLETLISDSTSFYLKGSGWYVTDYADKNKKKK